MCEGTNFHAMIERMEEYLPTREKIADVVERHEKEVDAQFEAERMAMPDEPELWQIRLLF